MTTPYKIHNGNSLEVLKTLDENSIDSIVCDPPYELGFMNKKWDSSGIAYNVELWKECLRVLKPGGHLLAFSGSRTYHRMAVAIEDAGFEIRDQIMWVYGSGFPKSLNVSKAIDKANGAEREVVGTKRGQGNIPNDRGKWGLTSNKPVEITIPATEDAKKWEGWGTALKPAHEPICLARKPFDATVAENVMLHGTGAINIDGCRIGTSTKTNSNGKRSMYGGNSLLESKTHNSETKKYDYGRFPANFIHDGSDEVVSLFPDTSPSKAANRGLQHSSRHGGLGDIGGNIKEGTDGIRGHNDDGGSAARFFYCAKASKKDRDEGLDGFEIKTLQVFGDYVGTSEHAPKENIQRYNFHPTVKPTDLMRYLCRLITPPNGIVLDPFMGSGSTGKAAMYEGFKFIGIDLDAEYCAISEARIQFALNGKDKTSKPKEKKPKQPPTDSPTDSQSASLW